MSRIPYLLARHKLEHYLDAYLATARITARKGEPLFRILTATANSPDGV
jgi:hypothetical protein